MNKRLRISNAKAGLGGDSGDEDEEDMTSAKISKKINNIITDGLVDVDPIPKRNLDEIPDSIKDEGGLQPKEKNQNLANILKKILKPEESFDKEVLIDFNIIGSEL